GIRVKNTGYGRANNFSVASVQPRIIDNAKRLVFDYWIEQSWVNESPAEKTLNLNLGNIQPGGSAVGAWEMYCIYTGSFTAFEASYRHSAELGGAATSLIEGVTTYRLIKDVIDDRTQKDDVFDFLVDTDRDMIPDYIFESDGSDEEVMVSEAHFSGDEPTGSEPYAELNLDNIYPGKWFYAAEKDPLGGEVGIVRVERKDGKLINERNWWLGRKGNFHLLDFEGDESYIVFYDVQEMDSTPPVTEILISSPSYYSASQVYVTTETVFTLRATDEDSEVDFTQYRVNDGAWQEYNPFKVSREGAAVIYYRSIDSAGNKEETKTLKIFVDIEPPESIIEFIGPSYLEKKR
ncbi:MAG: hypothetical protein U9R36_03910, partial [Elusimicrobiota bacterium]|nr:hypothetical protein [Elusimicrobiota bacterium]